MELTTLENIINCQLLPDYLCRGMNVELILLLVFLLALKLT